MAQNRALLISYLKKYTESRENKDIVRISMASSNYLTQKIEFQKLAQNLKDTLSLPSISPAWHITNKKDLILNFI